MIGIFIIVYIDILLYNFFVLKGINNMNKLKNVWIYLYFRIENDGECYI